ncbi:hypothetical protein TVAGG3_0995250 [Trichomonas vaginalis G3]|nr:hypothetical protein TVAGG3_0995250 [Trichomonas vaginalis G3]KAI5490338.1 hypothetical protein TVAGG3_0995250 [Trichomonas vaginalis G3]
MAKISPLNQLQQTLVQIIDTAALSDQMTSFAYDCLSSITRYVTTGKWENIHNQDYFDGKKDPQNIYQSMPKSDEIYRVGQRLKGFTPKYSFAWKELTKQFGVEIKHQVLKDIAIEVASRLQIPLDRDAKRRKSVLIKWFDDNWEAIGTIITEYTVMNDQIYHNIAATQNAEAK